MRTVMAVGTFLALMLCLGCASQVYRQEALRVQSINPHFALEYAAKSLESAPNDASTIDATRSILGAIAEDHRSRVKEMDSSGDYEGAVVDCDRVLASASFVKGFAGRFNLPYDEGERKEFAEKAAEKCYKQGQDFETQKQPREAFDAYCRCRSFRTNYKDTEQRMKAIEAAAVTCMFLTQKVAVPGTEVALNRLITGLPQETASFRPRFLQFVQAQEKATSTNEVTVSDISVNDPGWVARQDQNEVQTKVKDQYGREYVKVYRASWTEYTREITCTVTAGYIVTPIRQGDPAGAGSSTKKSTWTGKYVQWSGDKEAMRDELKKLPNSPPTPPPQASGISECMTNIVKDLASQLFANYK